MQVMCPKFFLFISGFLFFIVSGAQNKDLQKPVGPVIGKVIDSATGKELNQ